MHDMLWVVMEKKYNFEKGTLILVSAYREREWEIAREREQERERDRENMKWQYFLLVSL